MTFSGKKEKIGLFHVPIFKRSLDLDHKQIESYVRNKLKNIESYTTYYDNKYNKEVVEGMPFRKEFESAAKHMALEWLRMRDAPVEKFENYDVYYWFSVYTTGESHCLHQHPGAAVAGTYYPYADSDSTPIRFRNPALNTIMMSEPYAPPNLTRYEHQPETGDILVWPPWLEHSIAVQKKIPYSRSRIAISFNFGRPVSR
jgi:uncharacterized protein (TIGR02466 family)